MPDQFVVNYLQISFNLDGAITSHPVTSEVYSPNEIKEVFDQISYHKAGSLIRMLNKFVGPDLFYGALSDYLKKRYVYYGGSKKKSFFNTAFFPPETNFECVLWSLN